MTQEFPNLKSLVAKSIFKTWQQASILHPNEVSLLTGENFVAYNSPVNDAFLNWVWAEDINNKLIEKIDQFYQGKPHCYYLDSANNWLMADIQETELVSTNKYRQFYKNLSGPPPILDHQFKLDISFVESDEELDEWCETFCNGYGAYTPDYIKHKVQHFIGISDYKLALGRYNGSAVSTGMLFLNEGVAGIFAISTVSTYRKKGFAKQMSEFLENYARKRNCTKVALNATPEADPMYFKLGYNILIEEIIFLPSKYYF
ncbi:MAG: GNAT family N-acetyltransferase [Rickettsiales bacterium]